MADLSSIPNSHSPASMVNSSFAQEFSQTNTIRPPSNNNPRAERSKRVTQRKISLKKAKDRYSTDDMRLNPIPRRGSSILDVPLMPVSSAIPPTDKYYTSHDHSKPTIFLTPTSPSEHEINSDDNISYRNQNNSRLTDLILKPRNAFRESDAYRHFSRMIRHKGSTREVLTPSEVSERSNGRGPSDTNSEEEFSHLRYMHNRNMHHMVFHSQDMDKNMDAIKSDIERVKGDLRDVRSGHVQLENKAVDLEMKLSDFQSRITNIERILTDFTEMHHNEVQEVKQQLQQVQYDSVARVQDLEDGQDVLQRKIIELEVRSNMQESASQLFAPNGGGFFRSLLFKVLNVIVLLLSILAMTTVKVVSQFREHKIRSILILSVITCAVFLVYDVVYYRFILFNYVYVFVTRLVN